MSAEEFRAFMAGRAGARTKYVHPTGVEETRDPAWDRYWQAWLERKQHIEECVDRFLACRKAGLPDPCEFEEPDDRFFYTHMILRRFAPDKSYWHSSKDRWGSDFPRGEDYHRDHIVPQGFIKRAMSGSKGITASIAHDWRNIQHIPASENLTKGAKLDLRDSLQREVYHELADLFGVFDRFEAVRPAWQERYGVAA